MSIEVETNAQVLRNIKAKKINHQTNEIEFLKKTLEIYGEIPYKIFGKENQKIVAEISLIPQKINEKIVYALSNWKADKEITAIGILPILYLKNKQTPKYVCGVSEIAKNIYRTLGYIEMLKLHQNVIVITVPDSFIDKYKVLRKLNYLFKWLIKIYNLVNLIYIKVTTRNISKLEKIELNKNESFEALNEMAKVDRFIRQFKSNNYEELFLNLSNPEDEIKNKFFKFNINNKICFIWIQIKKGKELTNLKLKNLKIMRIRACNLSVEEIDHNDKNILIKYIKIIALEEQCNLVEFISKDNSWSKREKILNNIFAINKDYGLFAESINKKELNNIFQFETYFITLGDIYLS